MDIETPPHHSSEEEEEGEMVQKSLKVQTIISEKDTANLIENEALA